MSIEIKITKEEEYIFIRVDGKGSYQASLEIWTKIAKASEDFDCKVILALSNLTPLETMEAYDHYKIFKIVGITPGHRIAWVEKNLKSNEMDRFIETVLVNRGFHQARLFFNVIEAKRWLLRESSA